MANSNTSAPVYIEKEYKTVANMTSKIVLELSQLAANDLVDVGTRMDKQDPMLKFTLGKQSHKTARCVQMSNYFAMMLRCICYSYYRQKDAGTSATFPDIIRFEFPIAEYDTLEVCT